ncbi:isochorismate synthase [Solwaraspora sp. WMMB762]|uniref:isochorismate synthase n=1 Tax=Solwaraspora sp. WMMB762 TaxID=3404120 RepID=UPI003B92A436
MTQTGLARPDVVDLLDAYRPDAASFFFASPRQAMLTTGVAALVPDRPADLPTYLANLLAEARGDLAEPVAVGALPFAGFAGARMVVPAAVRLSDPIPAAGLPRPAVRAVRPTRVLPVPAASRYLDAVRQAVAMLRAGELDKVVLARCLQVDVDQPVDVPSLLHALAWRDPRGNTYAVDLPGGRTLLGASPELLVSRLDGQVVANPLAGSLPRAADPAEDRRRAAALRASVKDRREHAFVVDAVVEALRPYLHQVRVPAGPPTVVPTASMWHLSTRVTGQVIDPDVSALQLAAALHPTPAVCGTPVDAARTVISRLEPFDRDFYAGMVGWVDDAGDGEWVVGIRCAQVTGQSLRLYAGAGIVADSTPEAELAETAAKFRTMLTAMGVPAGETDE